MILEFLLGNISGWAMYKYYQKYKNMKLRNERYKHLFDFKGNLYLELNNGTYSIFYTSFEEMFVAKLNTLAAYNKNLIFNFNLKSIEILSLHSGNYSDEHRNNMRKIEKLVPENETTTFPIFLEFIKYAFGKLSLALNNTYSDKIIPLQITYQIYLDSDSIDVSDSCFDLRNQKYLN